MSIDNLQVPEKGFTKAERAWIRDVLIPAIKLVRAIQGRNCSITDSDSGQKISANDCQPCP